MNELFQLAPQSQTLNWVLSVLTPSICVQNGYLQPQTVNTNNANQGDKKANAKIDIKYNCQGFGEGWRLINYFSVLKGEIYQGFF